MKALLLAASLVASLGINAELGTIRGHVHYPGCFPPNDLTVCAEPVGRGRTRCTRPIVSEVEITYQLRVPPGRWLVYSTAESMLGDRRAYFSRAVPCGLSIHCHDHTPIPVDVSRGQTVTGVDPDDWWAHEDRDIPSV